MEEELNQIKKILKYLVKSNPLQVSVSSIMRDYEAHVGEGIRLWRFGCRDPVTFLQKHCTDCFWLEGPFSDPFLTPAVPESTKHIDELVQTQKKKKKNKKSKVKEVSSRSAPNENLTTKTCQVLENEKPTSSKSEFKSGTIRCADTTAEQQELKSRLTEIILRNRKGVLCTNLLQMYSNRYGRNLNLNRYGFKNVMSLACTLKLCFAWRVGDDWLLKDARAPPPRDVRLAPTRPAPARLPMPTDPEDTLLNIDFEPGLFPADCMQLTEGIPGLLLNDVKPGALLEVEVGEVYSPSHFWMLRQGEEYHIALQCIMDDMNVYYTSGKGCDRRLTLGAMRAGHYCSSCYYGNWHRSLIVKVLDSDTVKVRHVDYGTVETVAAAELRPLRRKYAKLPVQAIRARLAAVCPPGGGSRWPRASAACFLAYVSERRFVANVVMHDPQENVLEVLLIDTSTKKDRILGDELVRSGYADSRADAVTGTEYYLYPDFAELESGDSPSYTEIEDYLRDDIALDDVLDYRLHAPCLPMPARRPSRPAHMNSSPMPRPTTLEEPVPPAPRASPATAALPGRRCRSTPPSTGSRPEEQVILSASVCEAFALFSEYDVAQRFMRKAIQRARQALPSASPATN